MVVRLIFMLLLLFCVQASGTGQAPCSKYDFAMRRGNVLLEEERFRAALAEFQAALVAVRECQLTSEAGERATQGVQSVFTALQQQRDQAQADEVRAQHATAAAARRVEEAKRAQRKTSVLLIRADSLNNRNENLIRALHFYDGRFALSVQEDNGTEQYGYIDKQGNTRIEYFYDKAWPFTEPGYAKVIQKGKAFLIDTLGREFLLAEQLSELNRQTEALDLRGRALKRIPDTIFSFPQLRVLLLRDNQLDSIPAAIGRLAQLQVLDLSKNPIGTNLPQELGQLQQLERLELFHCRLSDLPADLAQLKQLRVLNISFNDLDSIPSWIGALEKLEFFAAAGCHLRELPAAIGRLSQLKVLNLGDASFGRSSGRLTFKPNRLNQLPEQIGQLKSLQELDLNGNQLTHLPEHFGQLRALEQLDLASNDLQRLPESVGQMSRLKILDISSNLLQEIPLILDPMLQLERLYLMGNSFSFSTDLNVPLKNPVLLSALYRGIGIDRPGRDNIKQLRKKYQTRIRLLETWVATYAFKVKPPEISLLYNELGFYYSLTGRFADAERLFRQAMEIAPNNFSPVKNLPLALLLQGRYEAARSHFIRLKEQTYQLPAYAFTQIGLDLNIPSFMRDQKIAFSDAFSEAITAHEKVGAIPEQHRKALDAIKQLLKQR